MYAAYLKRTGWYLLILRHYKVIFLTLIKAIWSSIHGGLKMFFFFFFFFFCGGGVRVEGGGGGFIYLKTKNMSLDTFPCLKKARLYLPPYRNLPTPSPQPPSPPEHTSLRLLNPFKIENWKILKPCLDETFTSNPNSLRINCLNEQI